MDINQEFVPGAEFHHHCKSKGTGKTTLNGDL